MTPGFRRLRFRVPPAEEDLLTAWLWSEGVEGISSEDDPSSAASAIVVATFRDVEKLPVKGDLPAWLPAVEILDSQAVEERDWLAAWRAQAQPI